MSNNLGIYQIVLKMLGFHSRNQNSETIEYWKSKEKETTKYLQFNRKIKSLKR
jgi:hypothetical protein